MATQADLVSKLKFRKIDREPNWLTGNLSGYQTDEAVKIKVGDDGLACLPVQQSDTLKPIYMDIVRYGLNYAFQKYKHQDWVGTLMLKNDPRKVYEYTKTDKPRNVIIVGAGIAGLAAAYELAQVGHTVQILELQERVGGRIKTFGEKEGFAKHLYVDAGAMRLPNPPDATEKTHYLTDFYASTLFHLPLEKFNNQDSDAFLKFYNMNAMTYREWNLNDDGVDDGGESNFNKNWPGWDAYIIQTGAKDSLNIKNMDDYYAETAKFVTDQLRRNLAGKETSDDVANTWEKWVSNWCRFPMNGYFQSTAEQVRLTLDDDYRDIDFDALGKLIPWPDEAVTAFSIYNYTEQLDQSLVQYLRDELGEWWSANMHHIKGGMFKLSEKFTDPNTSGWNPDVHLEENITYNVTVNEIEYTSTDESKAVTVKGYYSTSGQPCEFTGDAVIITTPLHIIRQTKITSTPGTEEFPNKFYQSLEDVWYGPSTKIMIQTKTRFWEALNIEGGFSKTNLPIGQLHYPTKVDPPPNTDKGILLIYTWKSEALQFGALHPQIAVREAVRQIKAIHPTIESEFEVGAVEAWYNEPSAQGAYVLLKPRQYNNIRTLMQYPWKNVFFAGEGISFAAGWIQGALESGLRAAYQFYARNEDDML